MRVRALGVWGNRVIVESAADVSENRLTLSGEPAPRFDILSAVPMCDWNCAKKRMMQMKALKLAASVASILIAASVSGAALGWSDPVYWTSGTITMPDGSVAGAGDVVMYAFINLTPHNLESLDLYSFLHGEGLESAANRYGVYFKSAESNASGSARVTTGLECSSGYENEWAKVLFVCEYDGHEYYKQFYGNHYATAAWPEYTNTNMATRAGDWIQGVELQNIPEPSSALLIVIGGAFLCLRRKTGKTRGEFAAWRRSTRRTDDVAYFARSA